MSRRFATLACTALPSFAKYGMHQMPNRGPPTIFPPMAMTEGRPASTAPRAGVTDARVAAADICADMRTGELLDLSFERRTAVLDARDRRWTRELVYGMLRRRSWLDAILADRVRGGPSRLDA